MPLTQDQRAQIAEARQGVKMTLRAVSEGWKAIFITPTKC